MAFKPIGAESARVVLVIETTVLIGEGTPNDPVDTLRQYWSLDGELLAQCADGKKQ